MRIVNKIQKILIAIILWLSIPIFCYAQISQLFIEHDIKELKNLSETYGMESKEYNDKFLDCAFTYSDTCYHAYYAHFANAISDNNSNLRKVYGIDDINYRQAIIAAHPTKSVAGEPENLVFPNLKLTFLSACQTGKGQTDVEGVWGLQRAFRIAGTSSLICTIRLVNSKYAEEFMTMLYRELANRKTVYAACTTTRQHLYSKYKTNYSKWTSFILIE